MEDLTKQQIILLTLLLSFVTSIGTGIITSSLLEQAPERVTQTINKVVEKTVENVLPTETTIKETETITRVIVDSDEAVVGAIAHVERSLVRVMNVAGETQEFSVIGIVIDNTGLVAITENGFVSDFKYIGQYPEGTFDLVIDEGSNADGIVFLKPEFAEDEEIPEFIPIEIAKALPKLGQSVINIGGSNDTSVQTGRVAKLITSGEAGEVVAIETSVSSATLGSLIVDYSGRLLGYNAAVGTPALNKQFILSKRLEPVPPEVSVQDQDDSEEDENSGA